MSSEARVAIRVEEAQQKFGHRVVFAPVSFEVTTGQVGVVTGPNGAGKSTLLRLVAGLLQPTSGKALVQLDGRTLSAEERRAVLGYVAPDLTLYRELTAAENLLFFARLRGYPLSKDDLIRLLTEVGLRGRGRDLVGTYSSGMRQRLKYAFARLGDPPILLLDEPTANLDVEGVGIVERLIAAQRERPDGGLVLIATNEARELAWGDTVVRLSPG